MLKLNYPGFIDNTNFKYLNIDEKIVLGVVIEEYPKYTEFLQVIDSLPKDINFNMSIYLKKQDTAKVLKDLTYKISSSNAEIKSINNNQIDIDLINYVKDDAINLRKEIQLNNQDIFNVTFIITFFSNDYSKLINNIKLFQSKLYSKGILSSITNFRHLDSYLLTLPINLNSNKIISLNERIFTTDSLSLNFPFYTKNVFDKNGIIFGFTSKDNKICNIDIFNEKYINSNMCILGSSGSGKSFFTKLLVIRHFLMKKRQYIFDIENEYGSIVKSLGGKHLNFKNNITDYYNILEIQEYELNLNNWFEEKVTKVCDFLSELMNLDTEKQKEILKKSIKDTYYQFEINEDRKSVYQKSTEDVIYINNNIRDSCDFPTVLDLIKNIKDKKLLNELNRKVILEFECFTRHSSCKLADELVLFNTSNLNNKEFVIIVKYFLNEIKKIVMVSKNKTIIYIDEIWKYLNTGGNNILANVIFEYYKTLRKYNSSIIAITQDITDFFSYENGNYGKSILNNCGFKLFFRIEFSDRKILENINILESSEINKIYKLNKGQTLLNFCNNQVVLNIKSNKYEEEIMEVENENFVSVK